MLGIHDLLCLLHAKAKKQREGEATWALLIDIILALAYSLKRDEDCNIVRSRSYLRGDLWKQVSLLECALSGSWEATLLEGMHL